MRALPFRSSCPPLVRERMAAAVSGGLYLVAEAGPACFVLREEARSSSPSPTPEPADADGTTTTTAAATTDGRDPTPPPTTRPKTYKVYVGELQRCSCGDPELCTHILFAMIKILRLAEDNPLVWQRARNTPLQWMWPSRSWGFPTSSAVTITGPDAP